MTQVYLVTVKMARNPLHDPTNKHTGPCPFGHRTCTDATGEHHTFATIGESAYDVQRIWEIKGRAGLTRDTFRVTRVEEAVWM